MDKEELTEIVLNSVQAARKIADDDKLYGKVKFQDIDFDKHDELELSTFAIKGEAARGFLYELQNFYNFPEHQELYFQCIKRDYFNKRAEIIIEVIEQGSEEDKAISDLTKSFTLYPLVGISAVLSIVTLAWIPAMCVPAVLFGAGSGCLYWLGKKGEKTFNNLRKERDEFFEELREETGSISLDQFKEVMYENKMEIEKYL
jgi:hypothetical protein